MCVFIIIFCSYMFSLISTDFVNIGSNENDKSQCPRWGSNSRPSDCSVRCTVDYETDALPTALRRPLAFSKLELLKILSFICIGSGRLLCHRPAGWCGRLSNMNTFGECAALQVDYTFRETNLVGRSQATPEATLVTIQHQYNCLIW